MKFIAAVLLFSFAALTAANEPSRERQLGQALDNFATIAGAWYLNQRCRFITDAAAEVFDSDVAIINVTLAQELNNTSLLFRIQAASKSVAESERYASCDEEASSLVRNRVANASEWAQRIQAAKGREVQAN